MKIIVTTCQKNLHLLQNFYLLAEKFLTQPVYADVAHKGESKSEQLIRIAQDGDDNYLAIMEEDFYLAEEVDIELLHTIFNWCRASEADRFSLQSKNAHSYKDWDKSSYQLIGDHQIYQTNPNVMYPFSLEASVWKKDFLVKWLNMGSHPSYNDGQIENEVNRLLRETEAQTKIYALDTLVMTYLDVMRGGEDEIKFLPENMTFYGEPIALYPDGKTNKGNRRV